MLVVAFQFPPIGGPGVHRSLRFANELGNHGYRPVVLTIDTHSIATGSFTEDESLLGTISPDVTVIRTPSNEPTKVRSVLLRLRLFRAAWFLLFPYFRESASRWPRVAVPAALEAITDHHIDVIYTTSSPFTSLAIGAELKRRTGLPWVADLRDPYTDGYMWRWPSKFHWLLSRRWERRLLMQADQLVVTSSATRELLIDRALVTEDRVEVLTNGF